MSLSAKQIDILNNLNNYLPELRKGQIGPQDGGEILLGDILAALEAAALIAIDTNVALGNSDVVAPSQKAAKTYVDAQTALRAFAVTTAALGVQAAVGTTDGAGGAGDAALASDVDARILAIQGKLDALIADLKV